MPLQRYKPMTPITPEKITGNPELVKAQAVGTLAKDVMTQLKQEAIFSAEKAGAAEGEKDKVQLAIGGQAAQAFNKAALQANKYKLQSDIALGMHNIALKAQTEAHGDPQNALKSFGAKYISFSKTYLSHVPKENQAYARNALAEHGLRLLTPLEGAADKSRRLQLYLDGMDNIESLKNSMEKAAEFGGTNNSEYYLNQGYNSIRAQAKNGIITAKQATKLTKDLHETYIESNIIGQYKAAIAYDEQNGTDTVLKFRKDFVTSGDLPFDDMIRLGKKLKAYDNLRNFSNGINESSYTNKTNELVAKARLTGESPTANDISFLEAKPERAQEILQNIKDAQTVYGIVHNPITLAQMDSTLQNLHVLKGKTYRTEKMRTQAINDLKEYRNNVVNDPVGVAIQSPVYREMLQNAITREKAQHDLFEQEGKEQPNLTKTQSDILIKLQKNMGISQNKVQVQTLAQNLSDIDQIKSFSTDDALKFLENKQKLFGSNFNLYLRGIGGKHGISWVYSQMMQMHENPKQRPFLLDVKTAYSMDEKQMNLNLEAQGKNPADVASAVTGELSGNDDFQSFFNTVPDELKGHVNNLTRRLAKYYMTHGMDANDAVKASYERAFGMRYNYIGDKYRVLDGIDANHVRTMMNYIKDDPTKFNIKPISTPSRTAFPGLALRTAFQSGNWINDPTDEENFMFVDKMGRSAMTPQGFNLFGQQVNRPYLSFTPADLQIPEFLTYAQNVEEGHFKKMAKILLGPLDRTHFVRKALELPIDITAGAFKLRKEMIGF